MPTTPERTPDGKWTLYRTSDGQKRDFWPVDGRSLLATAEYTADPRLGEDRHTALVAPGPDAPAPAPAVPDTSDTPGTPESPKASRRRGR